jgi:hypothetical protein
MSFISTLRAIADDPKARGSERVQASREGLAALYRGVEIFDISDRLAKLEALASQEPK